MNKTWKKVGKAISDENKKPTDISNQYFGILLCLLGLGMVITIPCVLIPFIGLGILYLVRRNINKKKGGLS